MPHAIRFCRDSRGHAAIRVAAVDRPRPLGSGALSGPPRHRTSNVASLARGSAALVRHQGTEQHLDTWINHARHAGCPESAASPPAWITATPPDSSRRLLRRRNRMATRGGARAS